MCVLRKVLNIAIWPALSLSSAIIYRRPGHKNKNSSSPVAIFAPVNFKLSPLLCACSLGGKKMGSCVLSLSPGASWPCVIFRQAGHHPCQLSTRHHPSAPNLWPDALQSTQIWYGWKKTHLINIAGLYCCTKPMRSFWLYEVENEYRRERRPTAAQQARAFLFRSHSLARRWLKWTRAENDISLTGGAAAPLLFCSLQQLPQGPLRTRLFGRFYGTFKYSDVCQTH